PPTDVCPLSPHPALPISSTDWLGEAVQLDNRRFVLTEAAAESRFATSLPGVFAVGDVRSSSVKRVASAVGEGAQVISAVHSFLRSEEHTAELQSLATIAS